jgi:hypothetical protein
VVEALDPPGMVPTSMSNICKEFDDTSYAVDRQMDVSIRDDFESWREKAY